MRTLYILVLLLGVPLVALTLANRPPHSDLVWVEVQVETTDQLNAFIDRGWLPANTPRQSDLRSFLRLEADEASLASFRLETAERDSLFAGIEPASWVRYPGPVDDEEGVDLSFLLDNSGRFVVVSSGPFEIIAYGVLMDRGVEWRYLALSDDTVFLNCGPLPLFVEPAAETAS